LIFGAETESDGGTPAISRRHFVEVAQFFSGFRSQKQQQQQQQQQQRQQLLLQRDRQQHQKAS